MQRLRLQATFIAFQRLYHVGHILALALHVFCNGGAEESANPLEDAKTGVRPRRRCSCFAYNDCVVCNFVGNRQWIGSSRRVPGIHCGANVRARARRGHHSPLQNRYTDTHANLAIPKFGTIQDCAAYRYLFN